jgi:hypothetical protein
MAGQVSEECSGFSVQERRLSKLELTTESSKATDSRGGALIVL